MVNCNPGIIKARKKIRAEFAEYETHNVPELYHTKVDDFPTPKPYQLSQDMRAGPLKAVLTSSGYLHRLTSLPQRSRRRARMNATYEATLRDNPIGGTITEMLLYIIFTYLFLAYVFI